MKVTVVCDKFPIRSETFIINQVKQLIDLGCEVKILSFYPGDSFTNVVFDKYRMNEKTQYVFSNEVKYRSRIYKIWLFFLAYIKVSTKYRKISIPKMKNANDYIIASKLKGGIKSDIFIAHFGTIATHLVGLKDLGVLDGDLAAVFHGSDITSTDIVDKYRMKYMQFDKKLDYLFPVNKLFSDVLSGLKINKDKIHVIHMGIDIGDFQYRHRVAISKKIKLVTTARLVEKKGILYALKACEILKSKGVDFEYKIIGDGVLYNELSNYISRNKLGDFVELLGVKNHNEVKKIINSSDIFILPSVTARNGDQEGIPVSLMEAMAVGIPVISTYHSGIPELIGKDNGILVEEKDSEAIYEAVMKLANDSVLVSNYSLNGRKKIEEAFCNKMETERMLRIIAG